MYLNELIRMERDEKHMEEEDKKKMNSAEGRDAASSAK